MSVSTDATESPVADSRIVLLAAATATVNLASYTPISITYTQVSSSTSDVYYQTADQSIHLKLNMHQVALRHQSYSLQV